MSMKSIEDRSGNSRARAQQMGKMMAGIVVCCCLALAVMMSCLLKNAADLLLVVSCDMLALIAAFIAIPIP